MTLCDDPNGCEHNHKISQVDDETVKGMIRALSSFKTTEDYEILQYIADERTMSPKDIYDDLDIPFRKAYRRSRTLKSLGLDPELIGQLDLEPLGSDGERSIDMVSKNATGRKPVAFYLLEPSVSKHEVADSVDGLHHQTVYEMSYGDKVENVDGGGGGTPVHKKGARRVAVLGLLEIGPPES